jgi:integrase
MAKKHGNGEGSIRQRPDGLWEARATLPDGHRRSIYGKTRAEVASKLTAILRDRDQGVPILRNGRQTVGAWTAGWLERVKPTIRLSTWTRYGQLLAHVHAKLGRVALARLTPEQVEGLYATLMEQGLSSTTVHHLHTVLHHALADALRKGAVARNVSELVNVPQIRRHQMHAMTREQAQRFLEAAKGDRHEALYVLALSTGMRQGELLALRWQDIDLDAATLQVRASVRRQHDGFTFTEPKTRQSRRKIILSPPGIGALRAHRTRQVAARLAAGPAWIEQGLVFCDATGGPLDGTNLARAPFRAVLKAAGLPQMRFHDLRHTAATLMLLQGVPVKIVSEMLGHASVAITLDVYSHVLPSMQADAAAAMAAVLWG